MKVSFRTKSESNAVQEHEFLCLSPVERFYAFLDMMIRLKDFPTGKISEEKDNFIIEIKRAQY